MAALAECFRRNGYIRTADPVRRQQLNQAYHRGYEVRLVVQTQEELERVRQLLIQAALKPGKPFEKHGRIVQPVYGRKAVERFVALVAGQEKPDTICT